MARVADCACSCMTLQTHAAACDAKSLKWPPEGVCVATLPVHNPTWYNLLAWIRDPCTQITIHPCCLPWLQLLLGIALAVQDSVALSAAIAIRRSGTIH
jgi:hypothetical protein